MKERRLNDCCMTKKRMTSENAASLVRQITWEAKREEVKIRRRQYWEEHRAICHRKRWHFYYEDHSSNHKGQGSKKNKPNWSREDITNRAIYSLPIHTLANSSTSCSPSTSNTRSRRRSDSPIQLPSSSLFHFSSSGRLAIHVLRSSIDIQRQRPFGAAGVVLAITSLGFVGNPEMVAKSLMISFTKLYNAIDKGNRVVENLADVVLASIHRNNFTPVCRQAENRGTDVQSLMRYLTKFYDTLDKGIGIMEKWE